MLYSNYGCNVTDVGNGIGAGRDLISPLHLSVAFSLLYLFTATSHRMNTSANFSVMKKFKVADRFCSAYWNVQHNEISCDQLNMEVQL